VFIDVFMDPVIDPLPASVVIIDPELVGGLLVPAAAAYSPLLEFFRFPENKNRIATAFWTIKFHDFSS
jgi:hypothetical protein